MLNLALILVSDNEYTNVIGNLTVGDLTTYGIGAVIVLIIIALIAAILGPLIYSALNLKDSWKGIAAMLGIGIVAFVCYSMADSSLTKVAQDFKLAGSEMKLVNGAFSLFGLLMLITTVLFVFSLLRDVFSGFLK